MELPAIWDAMTLMWRHYNTFDVSPIFPYFPARDRELRVGISNVEKTSLEYTSNPQPDIQLCAAMTFYTQAGPHRCPDGLKGRYVYLYGEVMTAPDNYVHVMELEVYEPIREGKYRHG